MKKYKPEKFEKVKDFQKFLDDFLAGKLKSYTKTKQLNELKSGNVEEIASLNFGEKILNSKGYTFLFGWKPQDDECEKFDTFLTRISKKYTQTSFFNIDLVNNEHP